MSTCGRSSRLCTAPQSGTTKAPVPRGTRAVGRKRRSGAAQRQRIDMIKPATMAPKPIAKFHADSDTMKGMRSPAT